MKERERSFATTLFALFSIGIVVLMIVSALFFTMRSYKEYKYEIEEYKKFVISQKKTHMKDIINHIIFSIDYTRNIKRKKIDEEVLKKELLSYLKKLRYEGDNYIFIFNTQGVLLMHPFRKQDVGRNVLNMQDPTGKYITKEFLKAANNPDGRYIEYIWAKPGTEKYIPKIGYAKLYKPWGWIIGTGMYMDDIEKFVALREKEFKRRLKGSIFDIFIFLSIVFLIGVIILSLLTKRIRKNVKFLNAFFEKAATFHERIDLNKLKFKEFKELARCANKMIDDIEKEEKKSLVILGAIPDFLFILDKNGVFLDWRGPEELLYIPPEEFLGKGIKEVLKDIVPNSVIEEICETLQEVIKEGKSKTINYAFPIKGRTHYFEARMIKIEEDKVLVIERDFTEKIEMGIELEKEKSRLLTTLKSIGDGVIVTDGNGLVSIMNRVAEELTGWKEEDAKGKHLREVFKIGIDIAEEVKASRKSIEIFEPVRLVSLCGKERLIADSASPIMDSKGNIMGMVIVFRDVTERERLQIKFMRLNQLETIGKLTGGIAHDFNNHLMALSGYIEIIAYKFEEMEREEFLRKIDTIKIILKNMASITEQLLALSKGGVTYKEVISLPDMIKEVVSFNLQGSSIHPVFTIPDDLWKVEVDEGQFSRAIQNIILNAKDAMPEGGNLHISMRNVIIEDDVEIKDGKYVEIIIKDEGEGIPENFLPHIFEPFFSTKKDGHGLGLSVVHSIIEKHKGYIKVESKEGEGTTFYIFIPRAKEENELGGRRWRERGGRIEGKE